MIALLNVSFATPTLMKAVALARGLRSRRRPLASPSHPIGLEDGVDRLLRGRWDAVLASKGDHLAVEPIQFETVARVEVVRHRRFHCWRKAYHQTIQLCGKVRRERDAGRAADGYRLVHQV